MDLVQIWTDWNGVITLGVFMLFSLTNVKEKAMQAVASVNEVMQKAKGMSDEQALDMAAELIGKVKYLAWLPFVVRRWLAQMAFDAMKKWAKKEEVDLKKA
jgi:hypothetical protein